MDFQGVLQGMLTGSYTVERRLQATYTSGVAVPSEPTLLTVKGVVQPASGRDLQRLPEGRRTIETRTMFSGERLMVGGQGAQYEADRVQIDGDTWEVQYVEGWGQPRDGKHAFYRCVIQARNDQAVPE